MADAFIRWHSYIIVAEERVAFNMLINLSGPFLLTHVSSAIALFLFEPIGLLLFEY